MRAIISVFGKDRPGIIAGLSAVLYRHGANILDISQTVMQGAIFTMVMLIEVSAEDSFSGLKVDLQEAASGLGMELHLQREEIFNSMHRI